MGCGESVSMPSKGEETYFIEKTQKKPLSKKGVSVFLQIVLTKTNSKFYTDE
jgi:hypothetical protein